MTIPVRRRWLGSGNRETTLDERRRAEWIRRRGSRLRDTAVRDTAARPSVVRDTAVRQSVVRDTAVRQTVVRDAVVP